jgi:hypothetical protein
MYRSACVLVVVFLLKLATTGILLVLDDRLQTCVDNIQRPQRCSVMLRPINYHPW